MQNIESTIVELGSIFQQLAHMVKEQEETIQRYEKRAKMVEGNNQSLYDVVQNLLRFVFWSVHTKLYYLNAIFTSRSGKYGK